MISGYRKGRFSPMSTRPETKEQALESLRRYFADLEVLYETVKDLSSTLSVERVLHACSPGSS
jgi:hypothetical protein